jgi:hypothetical protein
MPFETDKSNGFKFDATDLLKTGVYPEAFDRRIPFWETVDGVQYTEFGMRRKAGRDQKHDFSTGSHTTTKPIRGIATTSEFNDKVAYIGALDKIFSYRLSKEGLATAVDTVGTGYNLLETAGATTWQYSSTDATVDVWDSGDTVWDEGINEAEQWSFETFGSFVVGANGSNKPVIKKNNVNFNTFHDDQVSGATIHTAGSGYAVNDTLNQSATTGSGSGLTCTVTEVSGGGIVAVEITVFGSSYASGEVITLGNVSSSGSGGKIEVTVPDISYDKVKIFKRQGPHMLAFNYQEGGIDFPTTFSWCSADDLDDWDGSATNTAGNLQIREATGEIRCVTQLGNNLAVYTQNQMFVVSYIGLPNIFGYKPALDGVVGAVSPHSVVAVGRMNYGLSRDGFFVTDGASSKMIGRDSGMNRFFRENASFTELGQVFAFDNSKENEVVWGVPLGEAKITKEIYYNYKTNQWGMRDSNISAYHDRGIFNEPLSANTSKFYFEGTVPTLDDPAVSAVTKAHDLNNADRIKEITALRVGKTGVGSPTVSIGFTNTIDATPTYSDNFIVDDTFKSFPVRTAGRYIHLKVESSGASDTWELTDMVIQGRFEGER